MILVLDRLCFPVLRFYSILRLLFRLIIDLRFWSRPNIIRHYFVKYLFNWTNLHLFDVFWLFGIGQNRWYLMVGLLLILMMLYNNNNIIKCLHVNLVVCVCGGGINVRMMTQLLMVDFVDFESDTSSICLSLMLVILSMGWVGGWRARKLLFWIFVKRLNSIVCILN